MGSESKPRSVLITGCSSGIGRCSADLLKQRGYRVFASARKLEDVDNLKSEGFEAVRLDLADSESIRAAVSELLEATDGELFGLFNNGAYGQPGAVEDLSREALREQFEVNVFGTQELTNLIIPCMRRRHQGRIVYNSSVLGFVAMRYRGAYNASKYAIEGLADTLRLELRGSGVFVSLIEPGPIASRFRENAFRRYRESIKAETSVHRETYREMESRLTKQGPAAPFTLGPEAVVKSLVHALESTRPKTRYPVTFPTHLFAVLKRLLPDRAIDYLLAKID
jgi:NAD(P)-dependent dehydrogenase (short-subunit alcohol dehydrogenase family)